MAATLILLGTSVAAAATTVTYNIAGVEYATNFAQSSFTGAAASTIRPTEYGVWNAVVLRDFGDVITGGTFSFKSKLHTFSDAFTTGTLGAPTASCAKSTFEVHGSMSGGGSFHVTVTRYGYMKGAGCFVYLATVRGTASLVFP